MNRRGNTTGTREMLSVLSTMWDGKGMVDEPFKTGPGIYQTYKDALYRLVLTRLSQPIPTGLVDSILRMQGLDGGFHTGYSANSTYAGTGENTETTLIAIIALNEQPIRPSWQYPSIILFGILVLLAVLIIRRQRPPQLPARGQMNRDGCYCTKKSENSTRHQEGRT